MNPLSFGNKPVALPARDWLAGMAMQGILSNWQDAELDVQAIAEVAYEVADAMLEERRNGNQENN